jgi:hypothetical protein
MTVKMQICFCSLSFLTWQLGSASDIRLPDEDRYVADNSPEEQVENNGRLASDEQNSEPDIIIAKFEILVVSTDEQPNGERANNEIPASTENEEDDDMKQETTTMMQTPSPSFAVGFNNMSPFIQVDHQAQDNMNKKYWIFAYAAVFIGLLAGAVAYRRRQRREFVLVG